MVRKSGEAGLVCDAGEGNRGDILMELFKWSGAINKLRNIFDFEWSKPKMIRIFFGRMAFYLLPSKTTWTNDKGIVYQVRYGWLSFCVWVRLAKPTMVIKPVELIGCRNPSEI